jgi:hypothetical protein
MPEGRASFLKKEIFMITSMPGEKDFEKWKALWEQYREKLVPNRKSGEEILEYLEKNYVLTEIDGKEAFDTVYLSVKENNFLSERLPAGKEPVPKTFYLENSGAGAKFYLPENRDSNEIWGGEIERIFIGLDLVTGFFTVEGSSMLYDELVAFRGIDELDLKNYVITAQYVECAKKSGIELPE